MDGGGWLFSHAGHINGKEKEAIQKKRVGATDGLSHIKVL
jgi:hypothetical protein